MESRDGITFFSNEIGYSERDILIADQKNKKNILLKKAYYIGHRSVYGSPDGSTKTKFQSQIFFEHREFDQLVKLKETPKIKRIKIISPAINSLIGHPSLHERDEESEHIISLKKRTEPKCIDINCNYIKRISVNDTWTSVRSSKENNIIINLNGYIEIELLRRINYENVSEYINELIVYMQLYKPDKFNINMILVYVDDVYYQLTIPYLKIKYNPKHVGNSVNISLLEFLLNCYTKIVYRKEKTEIRNIPFIVLKTSRQIEDNFLMYYRFIECYCKKKLLGVTNTFISYSIKNHYKKDTSFSDKELDNLSREIICLRNHYVHDGYHFKNSVLKISFERVNRKKNPKDYVINNIDVDWIYERTKILYDIAIDIIFTKILEIEDYRYDRTF